jgi:hypothetical protein
MANTSIFYFPQNCQLHRCDDGTVWVKSPLGKTLCEVYEPMAEGEECEEEYFPTSIGDYEILGEDRLQVMIALYNELCEAYEYMQQKTLTGLAELKRMIPH